MATVQSLTKDRLLEIEAAGITSATISGSNHLILTIHDGTTLDSGLLPGATAFNGGTISGRISVLSPAEGTRGGLTIRAALSNGTCYFQMADNPEQYQWYLISATSTDSTYSAGITGTDKHIFNGIISTSTGLELNGTTSTVSLNGSKGTSGQVLTSGGSSTTPSWTTITSMPAATGTSQILVSAAPGTGTWVPSTSITSLTLNGTTTIAASNTTSPFTIQPTPTAKSAAATLTIAELLTYVITTAGSATFGLTLPTGTLTDAGIQSGALPVNGSFDWFIVNTVAFTVTITAGTAHTYTGNATVSANSSAQFRTRKTATNTFVTYRIG
jgi:hypothetical protein